MEQKKNVGERFDRLIDEHGPGSVKALDYGSVWSQRIRFELIKQAWPFDKGGTLLDIGCGFADLFSFLAPPLTRFKYWGIDSSEKAIEHVHATTPLSVDWGDWPDVQLSRRSYDVVVMNGLLYLYPEREVRLMIQKAWQATRGVLIFDCLSTYAPKKNPNEYYYNPIEILDLVTWYTTYVTLKHDMADHFFMVFAYKKRRDQNES